MPLLPRLSITGPASILEDEDDAATLTYTVTRSGDLSDATSVTWQVAGFGSHAASAEDFHGGILPSGTLAFAPGQATRTITLGIAKDTRLEPDEALTLSLLSAVGATLDKASVVTTVLNDDSVISITGPATPVVEGLTWSSNGSWTPTLESFYPPPVRTQPIILTVTRAGDLSHEASAVWSVVGTGAHPANIEDFTDPYGMPSGVVTFAPGEATQTIILDRFGNLHVEPDRTFAVVLSDVQGATIGTAAAEVTIRDDDTGLVLKGPTVPVSEGDSGVTAINFQLTRTGVVTEAEQVTWNVTGRGTFLASADDFLNKTMPSGAVTFAAGETNKTITVYVAGDTKVENPEGFMVWAFQPNDFLPSATAQAYIRNDDAELSIAGPAGPVIEGNDGTQTVKFTVTRTGDTSRAASADWQVPARVAAGISAADFAGGMLPSGKVTFAAGERTQTISVKVAGDTSYEVDESFTVLLSAASGATFGTATATATILNDDAQVSLSTGMSVQVPEGFRNTFVVVRTGDLSGWTSASWQITTIGWNPASPTDFVGGVMPSGTVTFAPGETSKVVAYEVANDGLLEMAETFAVKLSAAVGAELGISSQTVTIRDGNPTTLTLAETVATVEEGNSGSTDVTFTVQRYGFSLGMASVAWTVTGSGANPVSASDFAGGILPSGVVTFGPDETSRQITIQVAGDKAAEASEEFRLTLSAPVGAILASSTAVGTILNDDTSLSIAGPGTVTEGDTGTRAAAFTVTRTGRLDNVSNVSWKVDGAGANPASANDFAGGVLPSGTLSFAAGETSRTVTVNIASDKTVEPDEGFTVTLSEANGAWIETATASAIIQNDDTVLSVAAPAISAVPEDGNQRVTFTVTRSGDLSGTSSASWIAIGSGAAPASSLDFRDLIMPAGTVSFAPGRATAEITVVLREDAVLEPDETFSIMLRDVQGAQLGTASAGATILNDDARIDIAPLAAPIREGNSGTTSAGFTVNRIGFLDKAANVEWSVGRTQNGNNAAPDDFAYGVLPSGTVSFAPGEASKTIQVPIAGDTKVEADESFRVTLSNPTGATLFTSATDATILNDDTTYGLAGPSSAVSEGNSGTTEIAFMVTRSGYVSEAASLGWFVAPGGLNPVDRADFDAGNMPTGYVSFAPNETSKSITVKMAGDAQVERDETFALCLTKPDLTVASVTVTVRNDDAELSVSGPAQPVWEIVGSTQQKMTFTVTRSGDTTGWTSANWSVVGSGDYPVSANDTQELSGRISFAPGQTTKTITLTPIPDGLYEPDEQLTLTLSDPSPGATISTAEAIGTIHSDDPAYGVWADGDVGGESSAYLREGQSMTIVFDRSTSELMWLSSPADLTFKVFPSNIYPGATNSDLFIAWPGGGGVLKDEVGFVAPTYGIHFDPYQTQQKLNLFVRNDNISEGIEAYDITILSGSLDGASAIGQSVFHVYMLDPGLSWGH